MRRLKKKLKWIYYKNSKKTKLPNTMSTQTALNTCMVMANANLHRGYPKFAGGEAARATWRKALRNEKTTLSRYNELAGGVFAKAADIVLDDSTKRKTTVQVDPVNKKLWDSVRETIYLLVRDGKPMKIGGTRTGMKERFGSYKCGHCVPQRMDKNEKPYPGKMSVTNAHIYHTIEDDLLNGGKWEFWTWTLPTVEITVDIMGTPTKVIAQTYHAYESRCIELFKNENGSIPQLCDNADPNYR